MFNDMTDNAFLTSIILKQRKALRKNIFTKGCNSI